MHEYCAAIEALDGVGACAYEAFPFDVSLPQIARGRVVLPADEPGVRPYAQWSPCDGVEVPVYAGALLLGRFVVRAERSTCGVTLSPETRVRMLDIARDAAPTARRDRDPSARAQ